MGDGEPSRSLHAMPLKLITCAVVRMCVSSGVHLALIRTVHVRCQNANPASNYGASMGTSTAFMQPPFDQSSAHTGDGSAAAAVFSRLLGMKLLAASRHVNNLKNSDKAGLLPEISGEDEGSSCIAGHVAPTQRIQVPLNPLSLSLLDARNISQLLENGFRALPAVT